MAERNVQTRPRRIERFWMKKADQGDSVWMEDVSFSRSCYYICMALIGYSLAGYLVLRWFGLDAGNLFPSCRLYQRTGYYCVGCGGTRALEAFFQGHLIRSFCYHPAVDLVMGFLAVFVPSNTLHILTKGRIQGVLVRPVHFYILTGIVIVQWMVKNGVYVFTGVHLI